MKRKLLIVLFFIGIKFAIGQEISFHWVKETNYFENGKANQVAYVNFGDQRLWGWVEITITSSYGHRLATGKYTKRFQIGKNEGAAGHFTQSSEVPVSLGNIADEFKIGDFEFTNGVLRVPIYHLLTSSNPLRVEVKGMSVTNYDTNNLSITQPSTVVNNEKRDYVHLLDSRFGIGTKEPTSKLQVTSNDNPTITIGENGANTNGKSTLKFVSGLGSTSWNVFRMEYTKNGSTDKLDFIDGGNKEVLTLKNGGNVGIGTDTPDSKLAVNGTIHAKEVKVDLTGWPDYVFTTSYKLPTLEEVEKHIKENGHLVNIPSAAEVEKDGVKLGEMNKKLLEKIEELTLYTIQQEKELKNKETRIQKLEERLLKVEKLLNQKL